MLRQVTRECHLKVFRFIQMTCSADRGRAERGFCTLIMQNKHQTNVNYFYSEYQPFIPGA